MVSIAPEQVMSIALKRYYFWNGKTPAQHVLFSLLLLLCIACDKKRTDENEQTFDAEPKQVVSKVEPGQNGSGTPSPPSPLPPVKPVVTPPPSTITISDSIFNLTVENVPGNPSNITTLDAELISAEDFKFQYKLMHDETSCTNSGGNTWHEKGSRIQAQLGADGSKLLCITIIGNDPANLKVSNLSHYWFKDTVAPVAALSISSEIGPNYEPGDHTTFRLSASDSGSGISQVSMSIQRTGGLCLNQSLTDFDAVCPNNLPVAISSALEFPLANSIMQNGQDYLIMATATDFAKNKFTSQTYTMLWDSTAPVKPGDFIVTPDQSDLVLSWDPVLDAQSYVVVRRQANPVEFSPMDGVTYQKGQILQSNEKVLEITPNTTYRDGDVLVGTEYHYAVFALDVAANWSAPAQGKGSTQNQIQFKGIEYAFLYSSKLDLGLEWYPPDGNDVDPETVLYNVYSSSLPAAQDFVSPVQSSVGGSRMLFQLTSPDEKAYLVVRHQPPGQAEDTNVSEFALEFLPGTHHKLANSGRLFSAHALEGAYFQQPGPVIHDRFGNVVFTGFNGMLYVMCNSTESPYYCRNGTPGRVSTIAGRDGPGDGANDQPAMRTPLGVISGLALDKFGNVYIADSSYSRIRVICVDAVSPGLCYLKKVGNIYNVAGNGTSEDGGIPGGADSIAIGTPSGVAIDENGNILIADSKYFRLRIVCNNVSVAGFCINKDPGYVFRFTGVGYEQDSAENIHYNFAAFGEPRSVHIDNNGNIYFSDYRYRRIRTICLNTAIPSGFCLGKAEGFMYSVTGTGLDGDGGNDLPAATERIGRPAGITTDPRGNIFFSDSSRLRVRAICYATAPEDGFCSNRTVGHTYRMAGNGLVFDGGSNVSATSTSIGVPSGISISSSLNIILSDSSQKRLRKICSTTDGDCIGLTKDFVYHQAGTGPRPSETNNFPAYSASVGMIQGIATDSSGNVFYADPNNFYVRAICFDDSFGFCNGKSIGNAYTVAGTGVYGAASPGSVATSSKLSRPTGVATDFAGNIFFIDEDLARVYYVCSDVSSGLCAGKAIGILYHLAGNGTKADSGNYSTPTAVGTGKLNSITTDTHGNIFLADADYYRIRVICANNTSTFCSTRIAGLMYLFAGTGVQGNGGAGPAGITKMGNPKVVSSDPVGNLYIIDSDYNTVRAICQNTSNGYCSGKIENNMYRIAGSGVSGDALNDLPATTAPFGVLTGIAVDENYNVYLADNTYARIRLLCYDTGSKICENRFFGNHYRQYGNGQIGGGVSNAHGSLIPLPLITQAGFTTQTGKHLLYADFDGVLHLLMGAKD